MHWLTIATLVLLLAFAVAGWRAGLLKRVLEFAGMIASVLLASHYGFVAADWLEDMSGLSSQLAGPVGWLLVFAALLLVTRLLAWSAAKAMRVSILGWIDRWGGAVLGLLIGTLVGSILLMLVCRVPGDGELAEQVERDPVTRVVHRAAPALYALVLGDDKGDVKRLWQRARDGIGSLPVPSDAAEAVRDAVSERLGDDGE